MSRWKEQISEAVSIKAVRKAMEVAARDVLPTIGERIFEKGLASDSAVIGDYSAKPIYIEKSRSPRAAGVVKEKTFFFAGGYKEFKSKIGRGSKVNLKVFGRLQQDFLTPRKVDTANGVRYELKNEENAAKKTGAEDHFGKDIFTMTESERKHLVNTFAFEIKRPIT
jgi:hypothetical protein